MLRSTLLVLSLLALTASAPAWAQRPDAGPTVDPTQRDALAAYKSGDYARAAVLFEKVHTATGDYGPLFSWAQSERKLGHCARARELYQRVFAHPKLPTEVVSKVKIAMEQPCKPAPDSTTGLAKDTDPLDTSSAPSGPLVGPGGEQPKGHPGRTDAMPWYKDLVGDLLLGAGVVSTGLGGVYLSRSISSDSSIDALHTLPQREDRLARAQRERTIAIVSLAAGGVLVGGALLRYLGRSSSPQHSTKLSVIPIADRGLSVGVSARF